LIGSLRFWFEIICYFNGVVGEESFDPKKGRFEKEINPNAFREYIKKCGNTFECKIQALLEQNIPIPAIIFGTTGWRSLIEIKKIDFNRENFKVEPKGKILPDKNWYWGSPSYQGDFKVTFLVNKNILDSIFYPLLTFMDKYGFWGGKWNIGYGRLKVVEVKKNGSKEDSWKCETFQIYELKNNGKLNKKNVSKDMFLNENIKEFEELIQTSPKIKVLKNQINGSDLEEIIKGLIRIKAEKRSEHKENNDNVETEKRHRIWGTTKKLPTGKIELPQGSKIIPFIKKGSKDIYKGGFLSIVLITFTMLLSFKLFISRGGINTTPLSL
jgi:CRISPR-associated protein Cmr1